MVIVSLTTRAWWRSMEIYNKTLTHTPVTKSVSNATGDETLTTGTAVSIDGVFFKRDQIRNMEQYGQIIQNADAVLIVKPDVTISVDDTITYDSETFRVDNILKRRIGTTHFYNAHQCFRVS